MELYKETVKRMEFLFFVTHILVVIIVYCNASMEFHKAIVEMQIKVYMFSVPPKCICRRSLCRIA